MIDVNKYIGVPFIDGGRNLHGLDCWGLARSIYRDLFDTDLPEFAISALDAPAVIESMQAGRVDWGEVDEPVEGDLVAMAIHPQYKEMVNHVGIYVGKGRFIHTQLHTGCILTRLDCFVYKNSIKGIYRWAG